MMLNLFFVKNPTCIIMLLYFYQKNMDLLLQLYNSFHMLRLSLMLLLQLWDYLSSPNLKWKLMIVAVTISLSKYHCMPICILVGSLFALGHLFLMEYGYRMQTPGFKIFVLELILQFSTIISCQCKNLEGTWQCWMESYQLIKKWILLIGRQLANTF